MGKNILTSLIIFFLNTSIQTLRAQDLNIKGDTIFVNDEAEILIDFPELPKSFNIWPKDAAYTAKGLGTGVNIIAKRENTEPATLVLKEGGRNHNFVIIFKKEIDYNTETYFDYRTVKKLEQHVRETSIRKTGESKHTVVKSPEDEISTIEPANNSIGYYALLEQGDINIKKQNYEEAKLSFEKAHTLRPEDAFPLQRLEEIKIKIAGKEKSSNQENDNKYLTITAEAKTYLDQKKYTLAKEAYKRALSLRPGDLYATHQLEKINKLLSDANEQKEQQKIKDLYNEYIAKGEKAFNKNQLADARIAYEQVLIIKPDDILAASRLKLIDVKEKQQRESQELESNYNTAVQAADKYFQAGDFNSAKTEYNKAISFIKRPWPQDQVKRIDKILADQIVKENEEKQKLARRLAAEKLEKEKKALESNYDAAIQSADKYFKDAKYENAKIEYNKALDFIKRDWPQDQINRINKIIAEQVAKDNLEKQEKQKQELENKYNAAMQSADKYFKAADYANAKIEYNKALSIIPRSLPQEQITKINKIINDQIAKASAEKQRQARQAEIASKYAALVKNADIEFDKSNYIKAKKLYTDASALMPAEEQAKERLVTIEKIVAKAAADLKAKNDSIAMVADVNRRYKLAMANGKASHTKNDLSNARIFYEEAISLKPAEEEPKTQLKIINDKLAVIARENEINTSYDGKIDLANSQLIAKAYDSALVTFNEALTLKPSEYYPKAQIKHIRSELAAIENRNEIRKRKEEESKYTNALKRADKAVSDKRYEDAKLAYTEALTIHADNKYAQRRLEIINYQIEKAKAEKLKQEQELASKETASVKSKKKKSSGKEKKVTTDDKEQEKLTGNNLIPQATPISYSNEELKKKYPNINFDALPPEQPFNKSAVRSEKNIFFYDSIKYEKPRLELSTTDHGIKLICQGISFEGTNIYVKLLIKNFSDADFLTGAMMLTWTRKQGNRIKLYPNHLYPSPLPVIKPASESVIIYVCRTYDISDSDFLSFELIDRLNKFKLQMNIPGSTYLQEWDRPITE